MVLPTPALAAGRRADLLRVGVRHAAGRARIHRVLDEAGVRFEARLYDAEHTFMRDEGARADPAATDRAFAAMLELFG